MLALSHKYGMWFGVLVDDHNCLVASAFSKDKKPLKTYLSRYARNQFDLTFAEAEHPMADDMARLYQALDVTIPPLNSDHLSSFRREVYQVLRRVPKGRVTSYGLISKAIDSHPRAVGTAVASNPWSLFVPCHRVVPRNLSIGNYSMDGHPSSEGSEVKRQLLFREGVQFQADTVAPNGLWFPPGG